MKVKNTHELCDEHFSKRFIFLFYLRRAFCGLCCGFYCKVKLIVEVIVEVKIEGEIRHGAGLFKHELLDK